MKKIVSLLIFCLPFTVSALSISPSTGTEKTNISISGVEQCSSPGSCWVGIFQQGLGGISNFFSPVPAELVGYGLCGYAGDSRVWSWPSLNFVIFSSQPYTQGCNFSGSHNFRIAEISGVSGLTYADYTITNFTSTSNNSFPLVPIGSGMSSDFGNNIAGVVGSTLSSFWFWVILIAIAIPLAMFIITWVLDEMAWDKKSREIEKIQKRSRTFLDFPGR